ncbi:DUF6291 domain-containing protein [Flavivirga jejuensis]|uniref:DUF6291 domain-containing protein n=1 Tax=Flavivirga jejuensis TaxID=870487 RepID=A0ABT8WK45_9FLAO|nr:DUF6291 domain-containing protein [Flavivirga jejuensis]MDO5973529.1 DUF6291 domain-containing protein [Flavivirga jejuensis]
MTQDKKSFIIHLDSLDVLDELSLEQKGELIDAMRDYHKGRDLKLSGLMKAIFIPFKNQFVRDDSKYGIICERNRINGSKGGRPKKPKEPNGLIANQDLPKKADNENDSDSKKEDDNKKDSDKSPRAIDILKKEKQSELNVLWMQNKNQIPDSKKLIESFNAKMELEVAQGKMTFDANELMPRFKGYVIQWGANTKESKARFDKTPEPDSWESGKLPRRN